MIVLTAFFVFLVWFPQVTAVSRIATETANLQHHAQNDAPIGGVNIPMADSFRRRAEAYMDIGKITEARGDLRQALRCKPTDPTTYYDLAAIEKTNNPQLAAQYEAKGDKLTNEGFSGGRGALLGNSSLSDLDTKRRLSIMWAVFMLFLLFSPRSLDRHKESD